MYCMYCGNEISDSSRYCKYCGKLVAEDEMQIITSEEKQEETAVNEDYIVENQVIENSQECAEKEIIIEDIFFQHISKEKKIILFLIAIFMTALVAVIVFAMFFPELI